jgi:uncharacterized protein (TIGR02466 family)
MSIEYFFPTGIESRIETELADKMLPVAKKLLADEKLLTNTWGYKNTFTVGVGIEQYDITQPFVEFIHKAGKEYLTNLGYDSSDIEFTTQVFVSEMTDGDGHGPHTHPNSLLSGLLYLQVPVNSANIIFADPRPSRNFVSLPKLGSAKTNWDSVYIEPTVGLFLIWESWLSHHVPTNRSKEGRITMVFNLGRVVK